MPPARRGHHAGPPPKSGASPLQANQRLPQRQCGPCPALHGHESDPRRSEQPVGESLATEGISLWSAVPYLIRTPQNRGVRDFSLTAQARSYCISGVFQLITASTRWRGARKPPSTALLSVPKGTRAI